MSRFSAEPWQLALDGYGWRLRRDRDEYGAAAPREALGAADALRLLDESGQARGGRLTVEFRDNLLRYLVIDWPAGLRGRAERDAWIAERFRDVHGVDAAQWVIAADREANGDSTLCCAAPRVLVEAVSAFAAARRMRVAAMHGRFVAAANRLRAGLDADIGGLAICVGGHLTMGVWRGGEWRRVRALAVAGDAHAALQRTLAGWLPELGSASAAAGAAPTLHTIGLDSCALPAGWQCRGEEATA